MHITTLCVNTLYIGEIRNLDSANSINRNSFFLASSMNWKLFAAGNIRNRFVDTVGFFSAAILRISVWSISWAKWIALGKIWRCCFPRIMIFLICMALISCFACIGMRSISLYYLVFWYQTDLIRIIRVFVDPIKQTQSYDSFFCGQKHRLLKESVSRHIITITITMFC